MRIGVVLGLALAACNSSGGPLVPTVPDAAMMDTYDAWLLGSTSSSAPTFAEVAEPRDDAPKRFRAWLGWSLPRCPECPADNNTNCAPCEPPFPYVCSRPGRVVRCAGDDLLSMTVSNADDPVPASGVYVFEGRWQPASASTPAGSFEVTKVMPILTPPPEAGAPPEAPLPPETP